MNTMAPNPDQETPMPAAPEHGTLTVPADPGSLECVCGNTTGDTGFIDCSAEGVPAWSWNTPKPEGLADFSGHCLCIPCGRVYDNTAITLTNDATVVTRIDTSTPAIAKAIAAYYAN